jgi:hypothetical protein
MENPNFKNATIQYAKFVQSSSHTEMKAIFDTFIPFVLFKECLDKKEKNDQIKLLEEKKKKDATSKIMLKDLEKELLLKSNTNTKKKMYNKFSKNEESENSDEDSVKSEDPFDLTKDYEKVFNFNLITDEEKDEFRKGKPFPYLNSSLLNIINKRLLAMNLLPSIPRPEEVHFQLLSFKFRDSSLMRCPKVSFQQNVALFGNNVSPQAIKSFFFNNNSENNIGRDNMSNSLIKPSILKQNNNIHGSNNKLSKIKTMSGKNMNNSNKKFNKYKSQRLSNTNNNININNSFNSSDNDEDEKEIIVIKEKVNEKGGEDDSSNNMDKSSVAKESEGGNFRKDKPKTGDLKFRPHYKKGGSKSKILQIEAVLRPHFFFKTPEGNANKFVQCDFDLIKDQAIKATLQTYALDEDISQRGNKIAIPSDDLRKEVFIFDPVDIDLVKGNLNSFIFEEALKKRAKLLFPYRQNFVKIIIIRLLQFLFIIKSKIANKKSLKISNLQSTNGKMKLKEIRGSNIITFSEVKPFMKSKFGHFNLDVFREAYEKKLQKNEEIKRAKKLEELQKKFLDILQKDEADRPDYEEDDNLRNERRRNDANPMDIEKDAKMLLGAVYKPRKKMNYLNGLKMLIKEEAKKNKGSGGK